MKKLFLLISILFITLFSIQAQNNVSVHQDWKIENSSSLGSFYWSVTRSSFPDEKGRYWYYLYFYSNSKQLTKNNVYIKSITYVKDVYITMDEYRQRDKYNSFNLYFPYVICDYTFNSSYYVAFFYSYSKTCNFKIKFESAIPF